MVDKKQFIRDSTWLYGSSIIVSTISIVLSIVIARILDPELFGIYATVFAITSMIAGLVDFGLNSTAIYFISSSLNQKKKIKKIFSSLLIYKLLSIGIFSLLLFLFSDILGQILNIPEGGHYIKISIFFFIAYSLFTYVLSVLNGLKKFKTIAKGEAISNILKFVGVILALSIGFRVSGILLSMALGMIIATAVLFKEIKELIELKVRKTKEQIEYLKYGFYVWLSTLGGNLLVWTDSIVISILINTTAVGFYKIATNLTWAINGLLTSGYKRIILPTLVSIKSNKKQLELFLNKMLEQGLFLFAPFFILIIIISKYLIDILYGSQYIESAILLSILSVYILIGFFLNIYQSIFPAFGKPEVNAKIYGRMLVINIFLNILMIIWWGVVGAAIATMISWTLGLMMYDFELRKKLKININYNCTLKPILAAALLGAIIFNFVILIKNVFDLILFVIFSGALYALIGHLFGFKIFKIIKIALRIEK